MGKYTKLGIYDEGEVIIRPESINTEVFLDGVTHIACIRKINGMPIERLPQSSTEVYELSSLDCDIYNLFELDTWKILLEEMGLECPRKDETFMEWLVKQERDIPVEILDYLKNARPQDSPKRLLLHVRSFETAKWLAENGADLNLSGTYANGVKWTLKEEWESDARARNPECKKMLDYFFGTK